MSADGRPTSDLTARARIRDAAIDCFAEVGFDSSYRAIAARAGVSPGLITHHFRSKAGLRAECDAEVLRLYFAQKVDAVGDPTNYFGEWLAAPGITSTLLVYMLRAIHAGGEPARGFLESVIERTRGIMLDAVASGLVRPSRDDEARLRYLAYQSMGAMLVQFLLVPDLTPDEFVASLRADQQDVNLPILEIYTEGLLTSRDMLDTYVNLVRDPPDGPTRTESDGSTA